MYMIYTFIIAVSVIKCDLETNTHTHTTCTEKIQTINRASALSNGVKYNSFITCIK